MFPTNPTFYKITYLEKEGHKYRRRLQKRVYFNYIVSWYSFSAFKEIGFPKNITYAKAVGLKCNSN